MIRTEQALWNVETGWDEIRSAPKPFAPQLVFVFGGREQVKSSESLQEIQRHYPDATVVLASTSGEIAETFVYDNQLVVTALEFEHTPIRAVRHTLTDSPHRSQEAGLALAKSLRQQDGLAHVVVISDGLQVNGSELVAGFREVLGTEVGVSGGLAGDAARFEETAVGLSEPARPGQVVAIGFYGEAVVVGYASQGGWDPFGPERMITRSEGNVLYEIDNEPALALYKRYLGDQAAELPASALLFPLTISSEQPDYPPLVRTVLSINEADQSMTFAGDLPQGRTTRLMKANFDRIITAAEEAAEYSIHPHSELPPQAALLVSCVGRKLVLGQRVEDEVEAVGQTLGEQATLMGFYSYGELAPHRVGKTCELHNQTMTITTFAER